MEYSVSPCAYTGRAKTKNQKSKTENQKPKTENQKPKTENRTPTPNSKNPKPKTDLSGFGVHGWCLVFCFRFLVFGFWSSLLVFGIRYLVFGFTMLHCIVLCIAQYSVV